MQESSGEHIDKLFRDNLKGLQVMPPAGAWNSVAGQIPAKSPNTFRRIVAVAASLLVISLSTWMLIQNRPDSEISSEQGVEKQDLLRPEKKDLKDSPVKSSPLIVGQESESEGSERDEFSDVADNVFENGAERVADAGAGDELLTGINYNSLNTLGTISGRSISLSGINTTSLVTTDLNRFSIQPLLMSTNVEIKNPDLLTTNLADVTYGRNPRWGFGGNFSPLYSFRYTNPNSSKDLSYFHDKESASFGFTGGMSAMYRAKGRLSIQTGIQFSRTGVSVNELMFYKNIQTGSLVTTGIPKNDVPYQFETSIGQVTSGDNPHYLADYELPNGDLYTGNLSALPEFEKYEAFDASITQNFEFFEIPLLVRYKIIDRKFGMNVLSGIGTSLLVDNNVFMYYQDQKIPLGQTEDLSFLNFAGTLGLGFEYSFNPKLSLNIEPTFKYFLNSFNKDAELDAHPYFFGVYSGLNIYF